MKKKKKREQAEEEEEDSTGAMRNATTVPPRGRHAKRASTTRVSKKEINEEEDDERIAVIGLSAILPGGQNVYEGWESVRAGLDHISDLPHDRVDVTAYFDKEKTTKDKIYCTRGGFIPDFKLTPREFGLNMLQMEDTDANQTITLMKVKEAMRDAGVDPDGKVKKNIGCVLGIGGGQKASHEFYSRLNYAVVEKVRKELRDERNHVIYIFFFIIW